MLSITDKEIKSEKWFCLCHCESSWNINQIINLVLWLRHSTKSHPVFRDYVWKRESAIGQQQKACSMLIVSVKCFFQHGGFVKVQIKKPFGDQIRPATILFQDSITSKHAVSPQFLLVSYVAIPLSCFFFLKHYVETKEKTGRVLYRATAKMSKKCSLPMMPLREIWVQSVRSKV